MTLPRSPAVWAIVVAAGSGTRFGGLKQFASLGGGRTVVELALAGAASVAGDRVVLVAPPDRVGRLVAGATVVAGGATRSDSVRAGLAAVPADADIVVVHDAARPLATASLFEAVVAAVVGGADAAVPAIPVADTVKRVTAEGRVEATVDREGLVLVQTPQAFRAESLRRAHAGAGDATDDAGLVEAIGGTVVVVPGEDGNRKITAPADLDAAARLLGSHGGGPLATTRVGHGFDSHGRSDDPSRRLVLGGVHFPGEPGLAGHSDADVVAHAVADALLGAVGEPDIGTFFPDTDPALAGADSIELLAAVVGVVHRSGWRADHLVCTVVAAAPRLAARRAEIEQRLATVTGASVAVHAKRPEGLTGLAGDGTILCWAAATVVRS